MRTYTTHYSNGQMLSQGLLRDDMQVGAWTFYYEDGTISSKGQYSEGGLPEGIWTEYYENGRMKYEAISPQGNGFTLEDDNLQIINYWTEEGQQLITNGNGEIVIYHPNGSIAHSSIWSNKIKEGILREFYDNGQLCKEILFENGSKNGSEKIYHENGNLCLETNFIFGKRIGSTTSWYENGKIEEEGKYLNGTYNITNFWTEEGDQTLAEGNGNVIRKYASGTVYDQHFENGVLVSETKTVSVTFGKFIPNDPEDEQ